MSVTLSALMSESGGAYHCTVHAARYTLVCCPLNVKNCVHGPFPPLAEKVGAAVGGLKSAQRTQRRTQQGPSMQVKGICCRNPFPYCRRFVLFPHCCVGSGIGREHVTPCTCACTCACTLESICGGERERERIFLVLVQCPFSTAQCRRLEIRTSGLPLLGGKARGLARLGLLEQLVLRVDAMLEIVLGAAAFPDKADHPEQVVFRARDDTL